SDLFYLCSLLHISASTVCFSERISVSQSIPSPLFIALSTAADGTWKVCLLPGNLYCLHFALPAGISAPARTGKISWGNGCSGLFYYHGFLRHLPSHPIPPGI